MKSSGEATSIVEVRHPNKTAVAPPTRKTRLGVLAAAASAFMNSCRIFAVTGSRIQLLVRNSLICESEHCSANARNQLRLLPAIHRGDARDFLAESWEAQSQGGGAVALQSLPTARQRFRAVRASQSSPLRLVRLQVM